MRSPVRHTAATSGRRTGRAKARDIEGPIHRACLDYLRQFLPAGWVVQHTPNKPRSMQQGAREKRMGAVAGWPDLAVYGRAREGEGEPAVYFFEVKPPGVKPEKHQLALHDGLRDIGFRVAVVRSIDDVRRCAWNWSLPVDDVTLAAEFGPSRSREAA